MIREISEFKYKILTLLNKKSNQKVLERAFVREVINLYNFLKDIDSYYKKNDVTDILEKKFAEKLDALFKRIDLYEKKVKDQNLSRKMKSLLRSEIGWILNKSKYLKRGLLKPKGYAGDYLMLEGMYNKISTSANIGRFLDLYYINNDYVEAVRERKNFIKTFLENYFKSEFTKSVNILNLACGACRELRELKFTNFNFSEKVYFDLVDQDLETLQFAKKKMCGLPIQARFLRADILNFFKRNKNFYDLIYSIGVADYLPDSYLSIMFRDAYNYLQRGGMLIVAHKNVKKFSAPAPDWLCNWRFIPRTQREVLNVAFKYLPKQSYKIKYCKSRLVFYIVLKK